MNTGAVAGQQQNGIVAGVPVGQPSTQKRGSINNPSVKVDAETEATSAFNA